MWPYTESHGYISRKDHELVDYGPIGGTTELVVSDTGYFQVTKLELLGLGGRALYVPFSAVQGNIPGERVTVNCTEGTCEALFGERPEVVEHAL